MTVARSVVLATGALLACGVSLHAQNECTVTSTWTGLWNRVELNCGEPEGSRPRVAVVGSQALRTCPLLAGDRVSVTFLNDDPTRQPTVTAVLTLGDGGASSGDWCTRGFPPGSFSGPCDVEEIPPFDERTPVAGASWTRTSVDTGFRDIDNSSVGRVGISACTPAVLRPGVYRMYVQRSVRRATWRPCAADPARLCEDTVYETGRFEGGIYIDGGMPRTDSVTDVSPLLRGWSGPMPATAAVVAAGPLLQTGPLRMGGLGVGVPWLLANPIRMGGSGS